ncbi:dihydrofolate reductase [Candidatus Nanohalobium constans]|uniref:dihydrofolate reductase n=1 Tax=Candidatus Nanohalobium constans TaxID=2565781 RepID=A0A5Q0UFC3_9ARCH|nr:dihydrofolate reductase [Candidatus Nanohalobium constans]QGA80061.1 dihydrofolate reductase [Candidatus Nanohalobium constans]
MKKIIIAAVAENDVIGKDGEIPWHIPKDLQHFKEKTTGHTVVMGRKTFESLPDSFTPLPDRENIVLTRSDFSPKNESVKLANSLDEAWEKAESEKIFIIGGAGIYRQTMSEADKMILTEIHEEYKGDTYFPEFSEENWKEVEREEHREFDFAEYSSN